MEKSFSLLLFIAISFANFAQDENWRPIRTDDTYFYFGEDEYRAYRIDSVESDLIKTTYFPNRELFSSYYYDCVNPFGANWIGKEIIIYTDSTLLTNLDDNEIIIHHNPKEKTNWEIYTDANDTVFATAVSRTYENLGFITDSVITINLTSNTIENLFDIKISKHHGLISTSNFLYFPNIKTEFAENTKFVLTGQVSETISDANLTAKEIYDFNIMKFIHTNL